MTYGYNFVLFAVDHLQGAVAQDLSSRYCPQSKALFLTRFGALFALFVVIALTLFFAANRRRKGRSAAALLYIVACALLAFAIGSAVLVLYGVSACNGAAAAGLFWDWP